MALPLSPCFARSSKDCRPVKTTPVFGALVKVAPSKPTKATASLMPGVARMVSEARRMTASVRLRLEPGGSWKAAMK